ncbi:MAG: ChaN family lipoprotein [Planctomycetes bacterium]|nr:ChaN family lipoprotein [Planctomycetota bacterium]
MRKATLILAALMIIFGLSKLGCSTSSTTEGTGTHMNKILTQLQNTPTDELYTKFFDTARQELIDFPTLIERIKNQKAIYIAEGHTNNAHHQLQLNVLKEIYKHNPKVAVGMEFTHRPQQKQLDLYSKEHRLSEDKITSIIKGGFGGWYAMYLPIIQYAHDKRLTIWGLNVSRQLKKKMIQVGWENLTPKEQKLIARDIDTSNKDHKKFVMSWFKGMINMGILTKEKMEAFYTLQCIWDETMGESVANYFKKINDRSVQIIIIAGSGHIKYKFNIPDRAAKRYQMTHKTLIPIEIADSRLLKAEHLDSKLGDFLFFSELSPREGSMSQMKKKY